MTTIPTPLTARLAARHVAEARKAARALPRTRLAYSTATDDRPAPVDPDCPGCNCEISKSEAVLIFACPICAL